MEYLNVILPLILVLMAFILKLVVDKEVDLPSSIQAIIELPIDLIFLAITFYVATILSNSSIQNEGLLYSFIGLFISIIVVLISKKCSKLFINKRTKTWLLLLLFNIMVSSFSIIHAVGLLVRN